MGEGSYSSTEMLSVYSKAPANWANLTINIVMFLEDFSIIWLIFQILVSIHDGM